MNQHVFWHIVTQRKKIVTTTWALFLLSGITLSLVKPITYSYSTMVQIGTIDYKSKSELLESTATTANKLTTAYIPFVLAQFYKKQATNCGCYSINAIVPPKSSIIILKAVGSINQAAEYKTLLSNVAQKLIDDHSKITNLKTKSYEVSIAQAKNMLAGSKDASKLLLTNITRLDETAVLLQGQLNEKRRLLANIIKNKNRVHIHSASGAIEALLIDKETNRYQQLIDGLETYLLIDLNQQRSDIERELADNLKTQTDYQNAVDVLKNSLANISSTKTITPIMTSIEPVSLSQTTVIFSTAFLGIITGIIVALLYDFFRVLTKENSFQSC